MTLKRRYRTFNWQGKQTTCMHAVAGREIRLLTRTYVRMEGRKRGKIYVVDRRERTRTETRGLPRLGVNYVLIAELKNPKELKEVKSGSRDLLQSHFGSSPTSVDEDPKWD